MLEHVVDYGVLDEVEVGGIWKLDATVERNQRRPREAGGELLSTGSEFERLRPLSCGAAAVSTEVGAFQRPHLPRSARSAEDRAILDPVVDMRTTVMMSMMRALSEQVTWDLQGVAVSFDGSPEQGSVEQGSVEARFLYEGDVGDVQAECESLAETHCIADFPPSVSVAFRAVPNATRDLLSGEQWVFLRWEPET